MLADDHGGELGGERGEERDVGQRGAFLGACRHIEMVRSACRSRGFLDAWLSLVGAGFRGGG